MCAALLAAVLKTMRQPSRDTGRVRVKSPQQQWTPMLIKQVYVLACLPSGVKGQSQLLQHIERH